MFGRPDATLAGLYLLCDCSRLPTDPKTKTHGISHHHPVRFGDVDHAGIVYYPRFTSISTAFGDPFSVVVRSRALLRSTAGIATASAFPTVHVETDFKRRYGNGDSPGRQLR